MSCHHQCAFATCSQSILTTFQKTTRNRRKPKKRKQTVCVIAPWHPIGYQRHECNQERLPDLPGPAGELVIVHWRRTGRGDGWRGGDNTAEIHDSLPRNLVDWLHLQENACGKRILNQHSLLPCQCRTEPERGQNASAAHPYKHFRQWGNYICMGARDELGNLPFHGND